MIINARAFLLLVLCTLNMSSAKRDMPFLVHKFIVQPSSKLFVFGKTNVNAFTCGINQYNGKDTLVLHEGQRGVRPVFTKGSVSLDASSFDCGMAMMTSDFRKTIQSEQYPNIVIDFISFERTPDYTHAQDAFKGIVKITIGAATKLFEMDCTIGVRSSGQIDLKGNHEFTFSDFKMKAPSRMLGAVKVHETLQVDFHLVLQLDTN